MPTPADAPLRKVTLNLYEEDCAKAEFLYGHGWSTKLREQFHIWMSAMKKHSSPKTIGDLDA